MEATDRPAGPLVSGALLAEWAEWANSTRFSTSRLRVGRYDTAEVDAFREAIRDTFLGVRRSPLRGMRPPASSSQLPAAYDRATTRSRLTPSLIRPNRGWLRCGQPTRGDMIDGAPSGLARLCSRAVSSSVDAVNRAPA